MTRRFVSARSVSFSTYVLIALCFWAQRAGAADTTTKTAASGTPTFIIAPSVSVTGHPSAIVSGDLNNDGNADLVVANTQTGTVDILLGEGKGKFRAPVRYKIGGSPIALILGDFGGHGKIDLAIADQTGNFVSVLLGRGDGTFQTASNYTVGSRPTALAAGDFEGDGRTDLLVASGGSNSLELLANKGDGTFGNAKSYTVTASPRALAVGDFNGDGKLDVVSGNADGSVNVLLNDGVGRLTIVVSFQAVGTLAAITAGDFNRDGKTDLAIADSSANTVSIFLGNGNGSFQAASSVLSVGNSPEALVLSDVNADGISDLLAANKSGNTVSVILGLGDGTFQPSTEYVVGNSPVAVVAGDFNGDGRVDFATANLADGTLTTPFGNGDGTFAAAQDYRTHLERKSVAVGDLNGDGRQDLVVTSLCGNDPTCVGNGTASVFLSTGKGALQAGSTYTLGKAPVAVALADVNGDKKLDLIAVNRADNSVMVLLSKGDGTFQEGTTYSIGTSPVAVAVGDFNKDGKVDIAVASLCGSAGCNQRGSLSVLLGNGDGSFQVGSSYDVDFSPSSVAVGDLSGDGMLDLVVANACGASSACINGTASVLMGDGKGGFTQSGEVDLGKRVTSIALTDLNRDGKLDLVAANGADNKLGVLLGNGDGTFNRQTVYAVGKAPSAVAVGDFDADGFLDVAVSNLTDSTVSFLHGNGDGTLAQAGAYPVGFGPDALAALDLDGSGRLAVVTANGNSGGSPIGDGLTLLQNRSGPLAVTPTTTAVACLPSPSKFGQSVTCTATVAPTPDGGTVDFTYGSPATAMCTGVAVNTGTGKAACSYSALPVGSSTVTAAYGGDASFGASSGATSQTVNKADTTTAVISSRNPSVFGQSVTFTATVSVVAPGAGNPTGTVTFLDGGSSIGTGTLSGGVATFTTSSLAVGNHTITTTYPGDGSFNGNTGSLTGNPQVVNKADTTTGVTSSPNPSELNQQVTFTATVAPTPDGGTVDFTFGVTMLCSNVALTNGVATCKYSALPIGSDTVTATYSGDGNYKNSSGTVNQVVGKITTTTTLASSPNPSDFNEQVTFTATVAPTPDGGTVDFTFGATTLCSNVALTAGVATCKYSTLPVGSDVVTAAFSGNGNYNASSGTVTQTVNKATSTTAGSSSPNPSTYFQQVTFTATVTGQFGSTPTGSVSFSIGGIPLCTATLSGGTGSCQYQGANLPAGNDTVTCAYSGDGNFKTSNCTFTQTVNQATTTTTLTSSLPTGSFVNQSVTFTATVAGQFGGTPTGMVNFTYGATTICANVALANAVATCMYAALPVGTDTVTATYSGDSNFITSKGTDNQTVAPTVTTTAYTYAVNADLTISFTATVTPAFSGAYLPTGTVTMMDNGTTTLCSATVNGNLQATCSTTAALGVGTHSIAAAYSGDLSFVASTSTATVFTVASPASSQAVVSGQPSGGVTLDPTGATSGATVTFKCLSISGTGIAGFLGPSSPGVFAPPDQKGNPSQPFVSCYFSAVQVAAPNTTMLTICTVVPQSDQCKTGGTLALLRQHDGPSSDWFPYAVGLTLPGIVFMGLTAPLGVGKGIKSPKQKKLLRVLVVLLGLSLLILLPACGGGFGGNVQPPGTSAQSTPAGSYTISALSGGSDGSVQIYSVPFTVVAPQ